MNYIERLFGISPDAGSGLTEVVITVALFAILGLAFSLKTHFNRRSGLGDPRTSPVVRHYSVRL